MEHVKKPEIRYGDGYFNAVLMKLVKASFGEIAEIQDRIRQIEPAKPHHNKSFKQCTGMITDAIIKICAKNLSDLGYTQPDAESILSGAMGHYLDDRFSTIS